MKNFVLILVLITINGCAVQQMSGGLSNPSSPSSSSGMPSPSLPSDSQSSQSSSSSTSSGSPSDQSIDSETGMDPMPPKPSTSSGSPSDQSIDSETGMDPMPPKPSASSIFDDSLGDFDKEMAGERVVIAAANKGSGAMSGQEMADLEAIMEAELNGPVELESDTQADSINQSIETENIEIPEEMTGKESNRIPSCVEVNGVGEDKIARQLRVFAVKEDDPSIRTELWKQYLLHMGKTESQIKECIDDIK